MTTFIELNEKQRNMFSDLSKIVKAARENTKQQEEKLNAFLVGINAEVSETSVMRATDKGIEIETPNK